MCILEPWLFSCQPGGDGGQQAEAEAEAEEGLVHSVSHQ